MTLMFLRRQEKFDKKYFELHNTFEENKNHILDIFLSYDYKNFRLSHDNYTIICCLISCYRNNQLINFNNDPVIPKEKYNFWQSKLNLLINCKNYTYLYYFMMKFFTEKFIIYLFVNYSIHNSIYEKARLECKHNQSSANSTLSYETLCRIILASKNLSMESLSQQTVSDWNRSCVWLVDEHNTPKKMEPSNTNLSQLKLTGHQKKCLFNFINNDVISYPAISLLSFCRDSNILLTPSREQDNHYIYISKTQSDTIQYKGKFGLIAYSFLDQNSNRHIEKHKIKENVSYSLNSTIQLNSEKKEFGIKQITTQLGFYIGDTQISHNLLSDENVKQHIQHFRRTQKTIQPGHSDPIDIVIFISGLLQRGIEITQQYRQAN